MKQIKQTFLKNENQTLTQIWVKILLETFVPVLVCLTCLSLQILGKTQTRVFPISIFLVNPLQKEIVITPEPVTILTWNMYKQLKFTRKTKQRQKKFDDEVKSENCDVIVIFSTYGQFGAIWKLDSGCIVCKTYIFSNKNLLSYKNWKHN